jgi:hypothetical protein
MTTAASAVFRTICFLVVLSLVRVLLTADALTMHLALLITYFGTANLLFTMMLFPFVLPRAA